MYPSPAKIIQRGTWEMKCGLVRKLVKEFSLKIIFLKKLKRKRAVWNFVVLFIFNGKFDTFVTIQMLSWKILIIMVNVY